MAWREVGLSPFTSSPTLTGGDLPCSCPGPRPTVCRASRRLLSGKSPLCPFPPEAGDTLDEGHGREWGVDDESRGVGRMVVGTEFQPVEFWGPGEVGDTGDRPGRVVKSETGLGPSVGRLRSSSPDPFETGRRRTGTVALHRDPLRYPCSFRYPVPTSRCVLRRVVVKGSDVPTPARVLLLPVGSPSN